MFLQNTAITTQTPHPNVLTLSAINPDVKNAKIQVYCQTANKAVLTKPYRSTRSSQTGITDFYLNLFSFDSQTFLIYSNKCCNCYNGLLLNNLWRCVIISDKVEEKGPVLIPVPVPIFVPVPLAMYSVPVPTPFPFPIPIPVPLIIPTTRGTAEEIMADIKVCCFFSYCLNDALNIFNFTTFLLSFWSVISRCSEFMFMFIMLKYQWSIRFRNKVRLGLLF